MQKIVIKRSGQPPLSFIGTEIGNASSRGLNSTRWSAVAIYQTQGGRFIAQVDDVSLWQGERDYCRAQSFASFGDLVDWLRCDGELSSVAQEAIENAVEAVPELGESWQEVVD